MSRALWLTGVSLLLALMACVNPGRGTADPAPRLIVTGQGAATSVEWDTGNGTPGQIYVSADGGPDELFAEGAAGSQQAPWITATTRYEFRLYAGGSHDRPLASVTFAPTSASTREGSALVVSPLLGQALVVIAVALALVALAVRSQGLLARIVAVAAIAWATLPVLTAAPRPLDQQPFPDSAEYADAAAQVAHGNGYVTYVHANGPEPPRYPPGFSLALAPFAAFGDYPANVEAGARVFAVLYVLSASAAAWSLGGPAAGALAGVLIGLSPFARTSATLVLSDALAATLTLPLILLVRSARPARGALAGLLAGLVSTLRLSASLALPALLLAAPPRTRIALVAGAAPPLIGLGIFQWHTFGSPLRTGYDYWLPGVRNFDLAYAMATPPFGDGPWIVSDRLNGLLMQWVCPCGVGGPQAATPSLMFYPAVLVGLFWVFGPPLLTLVGLAYAWPRRGEPDVRFAVAFTGLSLMFYWVYYYQGTRFLAAPATILTIYTAVGLAYWLGLSVRRLRPVGARRAQFLRTGSVENDC